MKFKLPRQVLTKELIKVLSREMRKQKITLHNPSKNTLKQIAEGSKVIEKSGLPEHLVRKKLPHNLGHGIFLKLDAKPLLQGDVIAPYAGVVSLEPKNRPDDAAYAFEPLTDIHLKKEEQPLFDKTSTYHPRRLYSLKVDALKKGNFTRFINHSAKPNVVAVLLKIPSSNRYDLAAAPIEVVYFAKKTIHPGEQLLVSYEDGEKSYWSVFKIKPFPMTPKTFTLNSMFHFLRLPG